MLTAVFCTLSLGLAIAGYFSRGRLFNPLTLFALVWALMVSFSTLQLSRWQAETSDATMLLLIAMMLAFALMFGMGNFFKLREDNAVESRFVMNYSGVKRLFHVWIIIELFEVAYSGGLPILWHLLGTGKTYFDFGIPTLHGLMNAMGLVIIVVSTNLALNDKEKEKRNLIRIITAILLFYLFLITRQVLISALIEIVVVVLLKKPKLIIYKLIPVVLIAIIAFGIIGNIRTGFSQFLYVSRIDSDVHPIFIGFYWVYMYLTMTITNIDNLVNGLFPSVGFDAFSRSIPSAIASLLGLDTNFYTADYLVTDAFNVSGFFVSFYRGFNIGGVLFISALYGLLSGVLFRNSEENPSERNIMLYAVMMQIVLLSFFDNMLIYLPSSFQFLIILFLYRQKTFTRVTAKSEGAYTRLVRVRHTGPMGRFSNHV